MTTFKILDMGRASAVTASTFVGIRPEMVNPALYYGA